LDVVPSVDRDLAGADPGGPQSPGLDHLVVKGHAPDKGRQYNDRPTYKDISQVNEKVYQDIM
jgi:hypothetical protein